MVVFRDIPALPPRSTQFAQAASQPRPGDPSPVMQNWADASGWVFLGWLRPWPRRGRKDSGSYLGMWDRHKNPPTSDRPQFPDGKKMSAKSPESASSQYRASWGLANHS